MPYEPPPADLPAFPRATRSRRKTRFGGGLRARWKDEGRRDLRVGLQEGHRRAV
ncbi:MAG TPA: colicin E3/pyocin S6 family cytotoxin [Dehalococcoidia bacterium]|nr:colicin E3/pyocin S6 family cytotoxin [Dehalococcoidia bacterium]